MGTKYQDCPNFGSVQVYKMCCVCAQEIRGLSFFKSAALGELMGIKADQGVKLTGVKAGEGGYLTGIKAGGGLPDKESKQVRKAA